MDENQTVTLRHLTLLALLLRHSSMMLFWELARTPGTTIMSRDGKYAHDIFNTDVLLGEDSHLIGTKRALRRFAGYSLLAISF